MRSFYLPAMAAALLLILAACDTSGVPPSTLLPLPPPDQGILATSPSTTPPAPADASPYTYGGVLPNGADYAATIPGDRAEPLTLVTGVFSYMSDDGPVPVGEVRYKRSLESRFDASYEDGALHLQNLKWVVDVEFDPLVLAELDRFAEAKVTRSITLDTLQEMPVIRLSTPFTWVGGEAQVRYQTFVVALGCWQTAARCSDNHAVSVVSATDAFVGTSGLNEERRQATTIETSAARSVSDPNYLDPGPLSLRDSADLIWTGEEMIVWGGTFSGSTRFIDGAAFNPQTGTWRMLAPIPLDQPVPTGAVWADDEMIVVSPDGTFGYDPVGDGWRIISNGLLASERRNQVLFFDGRIYLWVETSRIHELTLETGDWRLLDAPDPGPARTDQYHAVLRGMGDRSVLAVKVSGSPCTRKEYWKLVGDTWEPLPDVSLATEYWADCSAANQVASVGDSLIIWDEETTPAMLYSPSLDEWREIPSIPLQGAEGPSGPVAIDDHRLLVPRWDEGAIFDATTETWTHVTLPGSGTDAEIIWTGEEFLAWGIWGALDAWRWTPPEGLLG